MRHVLDRDQVQTRRYRSFISHPVAEIGHPDAIDVDVEMGWIANVGGSNDDQLRRRLRSCGNLSGAAAACVGRLDRNRAADRRDE